MNHHDRDLFPSANLVGDKVRRTNDRRVAGSDDIVALEEKVRRLCLKLWPRNGEATARLALHGTVDVRTAQRIMAGQGGFSLPVYRNLLRSDFGDAFLELLMEGATAPWWTEVYEDRKTAALEKQMRDLQRQLEQRKARR
jgi:hypothetical protein